MKPRSPYHRLLRRFGHAVVHAALVILPLLLFVGIILGTATVGDVNTASAGLALGFVIYFQFMSERRYEPSTISYLVLVMLGLGSALWVWGFEVAHFETRLYALVAGFLRLTVVSLFILSLELATGDLPRRFAALLPESMTPEIPQDAFIRERRRFNGTDRDEPP